MSRSKQIGTRGETQVVKALRAFGLQADRKPLKGSDDEGDIWVMLPDGSRIMLEVKTGKQTKDYSRKTKQEWLRQAKVESENSGEEGFLVINSYGKRIQDSEVWSVNGHAFWYLDEFIKFISERNSNGQHQKATGPDRSGS